MVNIHDEVHESLQPFPIGRYSESLILHDDASNIPSLFKEILIGCSCDGQSQCNDIEK